MVDKPKLLIECPFFKHNKDNYIACEGTINNTTCYQKFTSAKEMHNHEKKYCSVFGGRNCPHYRTVAVLYDRGLK